MRFNNKLIAISLGAMSLSLAACDNQDIDFPSYEGGVTVYFPYQTPVRTIVLGSEEVNTDLDKQHKFKISATMGGSINGRNIVVDYKIDPTLVEHVTDAAGNALTVMPESYYTLSDSQISFGGNLTGSVTVQLADAFFADPKAVENTYIIPVVMTGQTGADRILTGSYDTEAFASAPARLDGDNWKVKPQDYVLFCVKYKNKYDAYYTRCGQYSLNGAQAVQLPSADDAKFEGHFDPVTDGIDCNTVSLALNKVKYSVTHKVEGADVACDLLLTFDGSDNCTIESATAGVTATGSGKFTEKGAKLAWGNKDRDLLELSYTIEDGANTLKCTESLVWKRSGVLPVEEFATKYVVE